MKKLFILAAAIVAFASCSKNEEPQAIVETREISFAPAATETRATAVKEYTIEQLKTNGFAVWGYVTADGTSTWDALFTDTKVVYGETDAFGEGNFNTATDKVWQPEGGDVKYWAPNSEYIFSAIYPKGAAAYTFGNNKSQTIADFAIADGGLATEDLLVSQVATADLGTDEHKRVAVGLTFDHMLARVHFQFTNTFADENVTIEVRNVKLHGAIAKADATIDTGVATWTADGTDKVTLNFQDATDDVISLAKDASGVTNYRLFIPTTVSDGAYTLTFDLDVLADGVTVLSKSYKVNGEDAEAPIALKGAEYANGKSYLFNANISGDLLKNEIFPIQFDVKVTDWAADTTVDEDIFDPAN